MTFGLPQRMGDLCRFTETIYPGGKEQNDAKLGNKARL